MAEESDQNEKTEEPTPKKLQESREKGQVATSREINHLFLLLAAAVVVMMISPSLFEDLGRILSTYVWLAGELPVDAGNLGQLLTRTLMDIGVAVSPLVSLLVVAALGAGVIQNGVVISAQQMIPKLDKISPMKGMKRLFSSKSLVEFIKGVIKIAVVGTVAVLVVMPAFDQVTATASFEMEQVLALLRSLTLRMLFAIVSVMAVIAVMDVLFQRWDHTKQLRMSRQEIKEEMKQSEGDPHVRARLRQIRQDRARQRMMSKVPEADVVITNPTHYAVALSYKPESMAAPQLVAKGADLIAQRIRELAEEHSIPIVQNPPLARALHASAELDAEIPPEHYRAVAEVIGYVMSLKRRPSAG